MPFVLDVARSFEGWADGNAMHEGFLPRVVAMHGSTLRGAAFDRITTPYTMWMVQRVVDAYGALSAPERSAVDAVFAGSGVEALLAYRPRWRVRRRPCRLVLERAPAESLLTDVDSATFVAQYLQTDRDDTPLDALRSGAQERLHHLR